MGYIAHFMRKKAKVLALVDCPKETFQPLVSTKTHLVFIQKKENEDEDEDYVVFMARAECVGHDSKGKPLFVEKTEEKSQKMIFQKSVANSTNLGVVV